MSASWAGAFLLLPPTLHSDMINVLAELERLGIAYEWAGEDEVRCLCPFHEDKHPSCNVNVEKRLFNCKVPQCEASGDFISFMARYLEQPRNLVYLELAQRYNLDLSKTINTDVIERYHQAIWHAKPLLKQLYARGIDDELIRQYRLGEKGGRITIPIPNENGFIVNIRLYLPGAPGPEKMKNTKGHSKPRLFPIEQLKYDRLVFTGGEMKAIAAAKQLNAYGIGAVCITAGEGAWVPELLQRFMGKEVYTIMDIDAGGRSAAAKICSLLYRTVTFLSDVVLPLDEDRYPKGDINDFIGQEKGDLHPLIESAVEWTPASRVITSDDTEPEDTDLMSATNAKMAGRRVRLKAVVTAIGEAPYVIPRSVEVLCEKDQKECAICPVMLVGKSEWTIHPESPALLNMYAAHQNAQREAIMLGLGIPHTCKTCMFNVQDYYNAEETRISPQLDIVNRASDRAMQPAICIGEGIDLNESYDLVGRMHPHPKTQQSTLLISNYNTTKDALSTYVPTDLDSLEMFRPDQWTIESLQVRLDALYDDLETNITRIFKRRDTHLVVDLTLYSPLLITFDSPKPIKGWVESLIVGDSGQGKSAVACGSDGASGLMGHYGLGVRVECKNASAAGLIGGLQQMGTKWFVSWGVIPTQDKRAVILDEIKGMSTDVIARLTDMRSSGIAEIPKIEKRRTHARVRQIWISNPRSERPLGSYSYGVEVVKELIGAIEDIRRFDIALLVGAHDIDASELNVLANERPAVPHVHTDVLCRSLMLWAWTREANQVHFDDDAVTAVLKHATTLCDAFTDTIPLVDRGSMRLKIARLAAALAARTFSTDESRLQLRVRKCHVDYIARAITRIYSSPTFGYIEFTAAAKIVNELVDEEAIKKAINGVPFPRDMCSQMARAHVIDLSDIQDWTAWERADAQNLLSLLVRKHALRRAGRGYAKTPPFIGFLKHMLENGSLVERPEHIPERHEF